MLLLRPQVVDDDVLLLSNISEGTPGVWSSATTYNAKDRIGITTGTSVQVYISLSDDNLNNDPATSPDWWTEYGKTYLQWDSATTYTIGDRVIDNTTHRIYESLVASNLNLDPTNIANFVSWLDLAPTNKWAMFDSYNNTQTTNPYEIDFTLGLIGRIDAIALINLSNAVAVRISITTALDGMIYDETFNLLANENVTNWYNYFFEETTRKSTLFVFPLPVHANPTVRIVITGNGESAVGCGVVSIGLTKDLGETLHDSAQIGITDYSRKDVDEFGNYTIVQRAFSRRGSFQMLLEKTAVDGVHETLAEFRTTPAVYLASEEYGSTLIFGFFRDFQIEIDYPLTSLVSIEIEGLT